VYTMAAEAMMRIEQDVKDKLEELKDKVSGRTPSGTIQKLIEYHDKKTNHIPVDNAVRDEFQKLKMGLGLRSFNSENDLIKLLLAHYNNSSNLSKETFQLFAGMKQGY
jgi:hypothetical protein